MTVLVESGAGEIFDSHTRDALAKAAVAPGRVEHIFFTHLHLDHIGGLLHDDEPMLSDAKVWLAETEHAFRHDDAATAELAKRLAPILLNARHLWESHPQVSCIQMVVE